MILAINHLGGAKINFRKGTDYSCRNHLKLRYLDIDLAHHVILLPQTKNGDGKIVYLNALAENVIASLPPGHPHERPFAGIDPARLTVAFKRACRRVGIEDFRFHDLRHTAASWLRMTGADLHDVALLLGHKDLRMSARYSHLSRQHLSEAVRRLDAVFGIPCPQGVPEAAKLIEEKTTSA